jgi:hypothetical protein
MGLKLLKIYIIKLVLRIAVFDAAILIYLHDKRDLALFNSAFLFHNGLKPLHFIWIILFAEIVLKFFPNNFMSMGCRKQFKSYYAAGAKQPTPAELKSWVKAENRAAKKVLLVWVGVNAVIALLYYGKIFGQSELVLLSLFYYVCDLIGVLLFCPFQLFCMKNRCCVTCRIFNWDALMICTPLLFIKKVFSWSLILPAIILLIWWEVCYRRAPERFYEGSNENLKCVHCDAKLCQIKKPVGPRMQPKRRGRV